MAKHNCAICGAEVGLLTEQQLADKTYICRKVCAKKCLKALELVPATLDQVQSHIEQVEYGTKVWNEIFVPLKKTKNKDEKLKRFGSFGQLYVSRSTGLIALVQTDYKIFIFGKTERACVYRIADLYMYEYETETVRNSEGKDETKHYCLIGFNNVSGLYQFRLPISSARDFQDMEKYFNTLFGIQKTLGNMKNTFKNQINVMKAAAETVKAARDGENIEEKGEKLVDSLDVATYGDRTEWIKKADATLALIK